jgi:hypothetical protein
MVVGKPDNELNNILKTFPKISKLLIASDMITHVSNFFIELPLVESLAGAYSLSNKSSMLLLISQEVLM